MDNPNIKLYLNRIGELSNQIRFEMLEPKDQDNHKIGKHLKEIEMIAKAMQESIIQPKTTTTNG